MVMLDVEIGEEAFSFRTHFHRAPFKYLYGLYIGLIDRDALLRKKSDKPCRLYYYFDSREGFGQI